MSGFLGNNYFLNAFASLPSHLDRGLYSSGNNMGGDARLSGGTLLSGFSISYWYYHTFDISSTSALCFTNFNAGSNDYGAVGIKGDGTFIAYARYNANVYHNLSDGDGTGGTITSSMKEANKWHHFHLENNNSGGGGIKLYLDGTLLATATANNQVDLYTVGWGSNSPSTYTNGQDLIASVYQGVFGVTAESHVKSATYIAQQVYAVGTDVPNINEVLNSTSTGVRNLLDINGDGTNTVLDTNRSGAPHQGQSTRYASAIFLYGANGSTDTDTHNSASQQYSSNYTVQNATRTQSDPFPVPETGDW